MHQKGRKVAVEAPLHSPSAPRGYLGAISTLVKYKNKCFPKDKDKDRTHTHTT